MTIEKAIEILNENPEATKALLAWLEKVWNKTSLGQKVDFIDMVVHLHKA